HHALDGGLVRHVHRDEPRLSALGLDLVDALVPRFLVEVGYDHPGSLPGEGEADGPADPLATAGDESHLVLEAAHAAFPLQRERVACRNKKTKRPGQPGRFAHGVWRRRWDSNPRHPFGVARFPVVCARPATRL